MEIRRIRPEDWQALREVRLRALADAPDAFGSSLEAERSRPADWWRDWARDDAAGAESTTVVADADGRLVGLAGGFFPDDEPRRVTVVAMWVAPEARGTGLGRRLLAAVEAWAAAAGAESAGLSVTDVNPEAHAFYRACGYADTGHVQPLSRDPAIREIAMRKRLRPHGSGRKT